MSLLHKGRGFVVCSLYLLGLVSIVGCGTTPTQETTTPKRATSVKKGTTLNISVNDYPRIDGSTSAMPLAQYIAGEVFGLKLCRVASYRRFNELPSVSGIAPLAPGPLEKPIPEDVLNLFYRIRHTGTNTAYIRLIRGDVKWDRKPRPEDIRAPNPSYFRLPSLEDQGADLILEARRPSEDELKLAKGKGVKLDIKPIALDAFVFIANKENPVTGLTTKQIQDIYTGKITDWNQVGGKPEKIKAFQRERNSGSQELLRDLVMKELPIIDGPDMIALTMMGPFNELSRNKNGICYSVFYYEEYMADRSKTKLLAVDGVLPSVETIRNRTYPYTTEVYVVTRADLAKDSPAYRLREWLLSDAGQQLVAKSGYVPIRKK